MELKIESYVIEGTKQVVLGAIALLMTSGVAMAQPTEDPAAFVRQTIADIGPAVLITVVAIVAFAIVWQLAQGSYGDPTKRSKKNQGAMQSAKNLFLILFFVFFIIGFIFSIFGYSPQFTPGGGGIVELFTGGSG